MYLQFYHDSNLNATLKLRYSLTILSYKTPFILSIFKILVSLVNNDDLLG